LDLNNLTQLEVIELNDNYLNNFNCSTLNPEKLTYLNLSANNLPKQNLSVFSRFTNLESLWIGNDNKKHLQQNIYNKFIGSLDYLSGMKQLRQLHIDNTDLNEVNIDKLPQNLERIDHSTNLRPDCKLVAIVPQLKKYIEHGRCQKCQLPNTSKN